MTSENEEEFFRGVRLVFEAFVVAVYKEMLVNTLLAELPETILVAGTGMAGYGSSNLIQTHKRMRRLYICGDGVSDIAGGISLMAPRVTLCAAHQANMAVRLILGESEA